MEEQAAGRESSPTECEGRAGARHGVLVIQSQQNPRDSMRFRRQAITHGSSHSTETHDFEMTIHPGVGTTGSCQNVFLMIRNCIRYAHPAEAKLAARARSLEVPVTA